MAGFLNRIERASTRCPQLNDLTRYLEDHGRGDPDAAGQILVLVYAELRKLAAHKMARENPGHTLQPTALVHEAWLRLAGENHSWTDRRRFFSAAAEAMRRILIDRARQKQRIRHGGGLERVDLADIDVATESAPETILFVHEALGQLAMTEPKVAELIKLRYFAGVPNQEAAEMLGMSERTARRSWAFARAWLASELKKYHGES